MYILDRIKSNRLTTRYFTRLNSFDRFKIELTFLFFLSFKSIRHHFLSQSQRENARIRDKHFSSSAKNFHGNENPSFSFVYFIHPVLSLRRLDLRQQRINPMKNERFVDRDERTNDRSRIISTPVELKKKRIVILCYLIIFYVSKRIFQLKYNRKM